MESGKNTIIFFSHSSSMYGAPRSLLLLVEGIPADKYNILVICPEEGLLVDGLKASGVDVRIIPSETRFNMSDLNPVKCMVNICGLIGGVIRAFFVLGRLYRTEKPSLIYVNTSVSYLPVVVAGFFRVPSIVHVRESRDVLESLPGKFKLFFMRTARKYICVSRAVQKILTEKKIPFERTVVIYNGVDLSEFTRDDDLRTWYRCELGVDENSVLIGFIGQIVPRKGVEAFIDAAALVIKAQGDFKFIVVGDDRGSKGYLDKEIMPLCREHGIEKNVIFTGYVSDVKVYLSAMDILVNASIYEPFARINLEAMAMGRPVVATDADGNPEAVEDGVSGFIVPKNDKEAMAERILRLARDKDLRDLMGKKARERVEQRFSAEKYRKEVVKEIDDVVL